MKRKPGPVHLVDQAIAYAKRLHSRPALTPEMQAAERLLQDIRGDILYPSLADARMRAEAEYRESQCRDREADEAISRPARTGWLEIRVIHPPHVLRYYLPPKKRRPGRRRSFSARA